MIKRYPDLLKKHRNDVFTAIQRAGMNTEEFTWTKDTKGYTNYPCPVIQHQPTLHYFMFCTPSGGGDSWQFKCRPGHDRPEDSGLVRDGWPGIHNMVKKWAHSLSEELHLADFWLNASKICAEISSSFIGHANAPFTVKEMVVLKENVTELKDNLTRVAITHQATETDIRYIKASLEHLTELAESGMGRIDWKNQLMGILLNLGVHIGLNPEVAISLFAEAQIMIGKFLNLISNCT